jgi:hypothetical protein
LRVYSRSSSKVPFTNTDPVMVAAVALPGTTLVIPPLLEAGLEKYPAPEFVFGAALAIFRRAGLREQAESLREPDLACSGIGI